MLKRLLQESVDTVMLKSAADFAIAVTAADHDRQVRIVAANRLECLLAIEPGHIEIQQNQRDAPALGEPLQRLFSTPDGFHGMAGSLQYQLRRITHDRLIVDNKDPSLRR